VPGGFFADLAVYDAEGKMLSENHYDLTAQEVQTFLTSVYPLAPVTPANSVVLRADEATGVKNLEKQPSEGGTYSRELLKASPGAGQLHFEFTATVPEDGNYYVRVSANSGKAAHQLRLVIDRNEAPLEKYDPLNPNEHLTRDVYSTPDISWYPGWNVRLRKGQHHLVFSVPAGDLTTDLLFDAIALQSYKELPDPFVIPGIRDLKAEAEVEE
jgi:hypothetical protein